jgi:hypothetical protein
MATRVTVATATMQLMEPDNSPVENAVLSAVLSGNNISNSLTNIVLGGMATKVAGFMGYAEQFYTLGLPQGTTDTLFTAPKADVAAAIVTDMILPLGVQVEAYFTDPLSIYYLVLPFLTADRTYDYLTQEITTFPAGMTIPTVSSTGALAINKVTLYELSLAADNVTVTITYKILTSYVVLHSKANATVESDPATYYNEDQVISSSYELGAEYCMASYYELDAGGATTLPLKWWAYKLSDGTHPALSGTVTIQTSTDFMPVVPIRRVNIDLTSAPYQSTQQYITGKALLKKIKLDIDEIATQINDNPDKDDIDHAYVMFGVNMQTTSNAGIWYLGEFFEHIGALTTATAWTHVDDILNGDSTVNVNTKQTYTMNTSLVEYGLKLKIEFLYITTVFIVGSIGAIGTATKTFTRNTVGDVYNLSSWDDNSKVVFKLQTEANLYKEVTVYAPRHNNDIWTGHSVNTYLNDVIDDADNLNFIVPVHYGVSFNMNKIMQNQLYQEALILVINAVDVVKLKWYESSLFKFIFLFASLAFALWSAQPWLLDLATAASAGYMAVINFILPQVVFGVALNYGVQLIVEAIGPEGAAILAILIFAITAFKGPSSSGISVFGKDMLTSDILLSMVPALLNKSNEFIAGQLENLKQEYDNFLLAAEKQWDELALIQEELEPNLLAENLLMAQSARLLQHPITDPEKFYEYTIHAGNIGTVVAHDIVPNFFDMSLKLPEPNNYAFANMANIG